MGWFGHRRSRGSGRPAAESGEPDSGLPMFADRARAARFASLAMRVFAERGIECTYDDGFLRGTDGRSYGLTNVAMVAVAGTDRQWRGLLEQHVSGIEAAHATPRQRELAEVRHRIYLRLWSAADLPVRPDGVQTFGQPLGEGFVGLAAIDHPEHVETVAGAHDIGLLGGWDGVRDAALDNLARLRSDDVVPLGEDAESRVQLSVGGFFNASRVFTMERLLREDFLVEEPSHGVLFVVPNRHLVAVHALAGPGLVAAAHALTQVARGESGVPGAISPHLWFWRDGMVEQVTRPAEEDNTVELHVAGLLEQAMRELGLVEGPE